MATFISQQPVCRQLSGKMALFTGTKFVPALCSALAYRGAAIHGTKVYLEAHINLNHLQHDHLDIHKVQLP